MPWWGWLIIGLSLAGNVYLIFVVKWWASLAQDLLKQRVLEGIPITQTFGWWARQKARAAQHGQRTQ